jgi:Protein of unknwon function (DUF3310)
LTDHDRDGHLGWLPQTSNGAPIHIPYTPSVLVNAPLLPVDDDPTPVYYRLPPNSGMNDLIDVIEALNLSFTQGCVLKYVVRAGRKGKGTELDDLRKAQVCLDRWIKIRTAALEGK